MKEIFSIEKFMALEVTVKRLFVKKLLILVALCFVPLFFLIEIKDIKATLLSLAGILIYGFAVTKEYQSFHTGDITKIAGKCIKVIRDNEALKKIEHKIMKSNVYYGKCSIYMECDNIVYEVPLQGNKRVDVGDEIVVWTAKEGYFYEKNGSINLVHSPYIVEIHPKEISQKNNKRIQ